MREAESGGASCKSPHFLPSSHRLKEASLSWSTGHTSPVVLAVGSVSIGYDGASKDRPDLSLPLRRNFFPRTIPPSMIRLKDPEWPSHISGIPGCCKHRKTCNRKEGFGNMISISGLTVFFVPFSSERRDTLSRITYICVGVI